MGYSKITIRTVGNTDSEVDTVAKTAARALMGMGAKVTSVRHIHNYDERDLTKAATGRDEQNEADESHWKQYDAQRSAS